MFNNILIILFTCQNRNFIKSETYNSYCKKEKLLKNKKVKCTLMTITQLLKKNVTTLSFIPMYVCKAFFEILVIFYSHMQIFLDITK